MASREPNLLYEQKIEMSDFTKQAPSEKSSEISEKSPFLRSDSYVKIVLFNMFYFFLQRKRNANGFSVVLGRKKRKRSV